MKARYETLEFIKDYFRQHCYAPSFEEIMKARGYKSKSSVSEHIDRLFSEGLLETDLEERYARPRAFRPAGFKCEEAKEDTA